MVRKPAERIHDGDAQLTVIIPERIVKELKVTAVSNGETLRMTVLKALKDAGYKVKDADLLDRRIKAGKARSDAYHRGRAD